MVAERVRTLVASAFGARPPLARPPRSLGVAPGSRRPPSATLCSASEGERGGAGLRSQDGPVGTDRRPEGDALTAAERRIADLHAAACAAGQLSYSDPATGYVVLTQLAHWQRGQCCGSACRHCPYGQVGVKDPAKKKRFNSYFYV